MEWFPPLPHLLEADLLEVWSLLVGSCQQEVLILYLRVVYFLCPQVECLLLEECYQLEEVWYPLFPILYLLG
jgi:hypothetical protein